MADDSPPPPPQPPPPPEPPEPPRPEGCEHCRKKCTVYFTRVAGDAASTLGMCAECPKAKVLLDPAQLTLFEDSSLPPVIAETVHCPVCGFTLADFNREKRLGCPECYKTFEVMLGGILNLAQPSGTHTGKHPARHHGMLTQSRLIAAREELRLAVAKEDFETAARLRDEIHDLELSANPPPPPAPGTPPPAPAPPGPPPASPPP